MLILFFCLPRRRPGFNPWVGKIPWRRKWQPTPVFLPGESQGQRSLVDYSPWGHRGGHNSAHTRGQVFVVTTACVSGVSVTVTNWLEARCCSVTQSCLTLLTRGLQHARDAAKHPTGHRAGPQPRNTCPQMPAGCRLRNPGMELEAHLKGNDSRGCAGKHGGQGVTLLTSLSSQALPRTGSTMRAKLLGKQSSRHPPTHSLNHRAPLHAPPVRSNTLLRILSA